jgi:alcohol dehydrogenase class IV
VPHGALCAALLPHVMSANLAALRRDGRIETLARFEHVARLLTANPDASADEGVQWVSALVTQLGVPRLVDLGIGIGEIDGIVLHAQRASSMRGNPVSLTADELGSVLAAAM